MRKVISQSWYIVEEIDIEYVKGMRLTRQLGTRLTTLYSWTTTFTTTTVRIQLINQNSWIGSLSRNDDIDNSLHDWWDWAMCIQAEDWRLKVVLLRQVHPKPLGWTDCPTTAYQIEKSEPSKHFFSELLSRAHIKSIDECSWVQTRRIRWFMSCLPRT